jgi:hypothetical protein
MQAFFDKASFETDFRSIRVCVVVQHLSKRFDESTTSIISAKSVFVARNTSAMQVPALRRVVGGVWHEDI